MKFLFKRTSFSRRLSWLCAVALVGGFISPLSPIASSSVSANSTTSCGDFAAGVDFGDLRVKSLHGKAFYTDFKNGLNATYIGYEITNDTVTALDNIWVQIGNFRAVSGTSVLNLVNNADAAQPVIPSNPSTMPVGRIPGSGKSFVYFLLKASDVSANAQLHDVRIFRGNPTNGGVAYGATYNCYYELLAVKRTLAASANKVTAINVTSTPQIGGTVTVTVDGATGVGGSGDATLDGDAMWLSPASASSWPTRALRLETVSIAIKLRKNSPSSTTINNNLLITKIACVGVTGQCTKFGSGTTYKATYTFRIIGSATSNPEVMPAAQIASGTQMKHTGTYPTTIAVIDVSNPTRTVTVTKEVNSAVAITKSGTNFLVGYKVTLTNTDTSDVVVDEVLDIPESNVSLQAGSVRVIDKYRTAIEPATALNPEPTTKDSQGRYHFTGPFTVAANATATLTYVMVIPEPSQYPTSVQNTAYGAVGSALFGATTDTSFVKECELTLTGTDGSSSSSCVNVSADPLPQEITFPQPPNQGAGTSYTLDANSDSGLQVSYQVLSGPCVLSGISVIYQAEGTCRIEATQTGNTTYSAATPVERSVTILPQQIVTFTQPPSMTTSSSQTVTITASSGLRVTLTSLDTTICKVGATTATAAESFTPSSGDSFVIASYTLRGTCPLVATQAGDGVNYGAAVPVDRNVGVGLSTQVLRTISPVPPETTSSSSNVNWNVSSETSTGTLLNLPVDFTSLTPTVCEAGDGAEIKSGNTYQYYQSIITWKTTGLCVVQADQDGFDSTGVQSAYGPAEPITLTMSYGAVPIVTIETASNVKSGAIFNVTVVVARPADGIGSAPTGTLTLFTSGSALSSAQQSSAVFVENVSGVSNKHVFTVSASELPATGESGAISLFATFKSNSGTYTDSQTASASNVVVYSPAAVLVTRGAVAVEKNATVDATVTVVGNSSYGTPKGTSTVTVTGGTVSTAMPVTLDAQGKATVTLTAGSNASVDLVVNATYTPTDTSMTYFNSQSGSVTSLANRTIDIFQKFTVTYSTHGATETFDVVSVVEGSPTTLPTPTRANDGYTTFTFNGWYTEQNAGDKIGNAGASYTPTADITLHAQWTAATPDFTVTYNVHGGSESIDPVTRAAGTPITLPSATRANSTYGTFTFLGWFTAPAGSDGTKVGDADASYTPTANVTLHARWTETIPDRTVTYNAQGGTLLAYSATVQAGTSLNLPTPLRTSTYGTFTFLGWFTASTAPNGIRVGGGDDPYLVENDITLFARWTETIPDRTVTYNAQGGEVERASDVVQPEVVVTLPIPTRTSTYGTFTFLGWFTAPTAPDGTQVGDVNNEYTVTTTITLYARWTETVPDFTVNFDPQGGTVSPTSKTARAGTAVSLPVPVVPVETPTYELVGWFTEPTGGTRVGGSNDLYVLTADNVTLYAQWDEPVAPAATLYTVTFDANGADGDPSVSSVQQASDGSAVQLAGVGTMAHTNYEFMGWATSRDATTAEFDAELTGFVPTGDITLFAVWKLRTDVLFSLAGYVWLDLNADGVVNANEAKLPGLPVTFGNRSGGVQAASMRVRTTSTAITTDVNGWYSFTGLAPGTWSVIAEVPAKLDVTQNSDGKSEASVNAVVRDSDNTSTWVGVAGRALIDAPIFGVDEKPISETMQVIWEGLDEKLDTWDDVTLLLSPKNNVLTMSRLPSGRYRLIRVGATPATSECAAITLVDAKVFTAAIRTQPGVNCSPSSATASVGNSLALGMPAGFESELPDAGMGYSTLSYWLFISLMFLWAGTATMTGARRRRSVPPLKQD